jgi:hypothetical protein
MLEATRWFSGLTGRRSFVGAVPQVVPESCPVWNASLCADLFPSLRTRADLLRIVRPGGIGIELGVSRGLFSELLLQDETLSYLYSVDSYGDAKHREDKYLAALARLAPYRSRNSIVRLRFDEAVALFPDGYFDFVYVDGCAGTGQERGQTIQDWWPKVRAGGVFAGHDYCGKWPLVMKAVDGFAAGMDLQVFTVGGAADRHDPQNLYTSWFLVRPFGSA